MNNEKYVKFQTIKLKDRTWPDKEIQNAPIWCSVDLRDGNQALVTPMTVEEKIKMFKLLVKMGFKQIEVGFPSASQIEFDFIRKLIDENLVPDDVTLQVLTQARTHLINRTFESLKGLKKAIVHIYNSVSVLQRDVVFHKSKEEIKKIATDGVKLVRDLSENFDGEILLEYSPESFTGTEVEYALEVCEAVLDTWGADDNKKVIINLPSTVEMDLANVYADQIEYMCRNFTNRNRVIVSLHPHNDRGCGIACAELGLLAGADRVEGTLFGNGERTGNVDIVAVALNMYVHGVDPKLDFSNMNEIKDTYEEVTKIPLTDRHPYAGKLVFTAFSGSHQDAINKGMSEYVGRKSEVWAIPYLPIDPADLGRQYEPIVRINSQSGKGGIAFVLEQNYGFKLPKAMQADFSNIIQKISEAKGEITTETIYNEYIKNYVTFCPHLKFKKHQAIDISDQGMEYDRNFIINCTLNDKEMIYSGFGDGPIEAVVDAVNKSGLVNINIVDYMEHSLSKGSGADAACYIEVVDNDTNKHYYGCGIDKSIIVSTIKAIFITINKILDTRN